MFKSIINVGVLPGHGFRERRVIQITNIISVLVGLVLIPLASLNFYIGEQLNSFILLAFCLVYLSNLFWNKLKLYIIPKLILVFLITFNPFIHILMVGKTPDGQYLSYIVIPIILASIAGILFSGKNDRMLYYLSMAYFVLWMLFIDIIIYEISDPKPNIDYILENYYFYKAPPLAALFILAMMISAFIGIINRYEEENDKAKSQLEDKVKERTSKLSETYKKIVQLAFLTSHEIRGPLASILGLTNLFKNEVATDEMTEHLSKLHEKAKEMDKVIAQMNQELETMPDPTQMD